MLTLIGVTHSTAIELFLFKDATEFGGWEGSTAFKKIRIEAPLTTRIPPVYSTITHISLSGKNKALVTQIKSFMQNWNNSGWSLYQLLHKSKQWQLLPFSCCQQQLSGHHPQVANVSIFLGLSLRFSESRTHVILLRRWREARLLSSTVEKALTETYAENYFGERGYFHCQQKWKRWVLETDQAHEVPQCEMNSFSSLFLCAKALVRWLNADFVSKSKQEFSPLYWKDNSVTLCTLSFLISHTFYGLQERKLWIVKAKNLFRQQY